MGYAKEEMETVLVFDYEVGNWIFYRKWRKTPTALAQWQFNKKNFGKKLICFPFRRVMNDNKIRQANLYIQS